MTYIQTQLKKKLFILVVVEKLSLELGVQMILLTCSIDLAGKGDMLMLKHD